jgi:hypothetical protein
MQPNDTNQRPRSNRTVALRMRAVPALTRRASLRVLSCVLIVPSLGRVTYVRSGSTRIAPVVNKNFLAAPCFALNLGKPIRGPVHVPFLDASHFDNASDRFRQPLAYTSFELSGHHGVPSTRIATLCLRRFHSLRSD